MLFKTRKCISLNMLFMNRKHNAKYYWITHTAMLYQSMTDADYSVNNIPSLFLYGVSLTANYDQSMMQEDWCSLFC